MKKLLSIITFMAFFFLANISYAQYVTETGIKNEKGTQKIESTKDIAYQIDNKINNDSVPIVYKINDSLFFQIVRFSKRTFHLIIFYTDWCKPCQSEMPYFKRIAANSTLAVYFIEPDPLRFSSLIRNYLKKKGILQPTFILDDSYKKNVKRRFYKFRDQICPDCKEITGFPSVILMNKERKVIYEKTGIIDTLQLNRIIKQNHSVGMFKEENKISSKR